MTETTATAVRAWLRRLVYGAIIVCALVTAGMIGLGQHRQLYCVDPVDHHSDLPALGPTHRILRDPGALIALEALAAIVAVIVNAIVSRRRSLAGVMAIGMSLLCYLVLLLVMDRPHGHHPTFGDARLGQALGYLGWALLALIVVEPAVAALEWRARRRGVAVVPPAAVG